VAVGLLQAVVMMPRCVVAVRYGGLHPPYGAVVWNGGTAWRYVLAGYTRPTVLLFGMAERRGGMFWRVTPALRCCCMEWLNGMAVCCGGLSLPK